MRGRKYGRRLSAEPTSLEEPKRIMVNRGYRGHDYLGSALVHVAGSIPKTATRAFRKMLKRRSVLEPTIGHLKVIIAWKEII